MKIHYRSSRGFPPVHAANKKTSEILVEALELFKDGKAWTQGAFTGWNFASEQQTFCMLGALNHVVMGDATCESPYAEVAKNYIVKELGTRGGRFGHIPIFNDFPETQFSDVKAVMCGAIKTALADEEKAEGQGPSCRKDPVTGMVTCD